MYDRVVAALVAMVLLMFSVSAALASGECHHDTAQCLAALDVQAEEVLSADLEVVSSLGLEYIREAEPRDTQNDTNAIANVHDQEATASGAAGVYSSLTLDLCDQLAAPTWSQGVGGAGV